MGIRFRKRVKITKGTHINISKSGISLSLGTKGNIVNIGKSGVRHTIGIPGTGISYSRKVIGNRSKKSSHTSNNYSSGNNIPAELQIKMDSDGKVLFLSADGTLITDDTVIRRIKATDFYKQTKIQLDEQRQRLLSQMYENSLLEIDNLISIYKLAPKVEPQFYYTNLLNTIAPEQYLIPKYLIPLPSQDIIRDDLEKEAKKTVKGNIFRIKRLRKEYVEKNFALRFQAAISDWEKGYDTYMIKQKELQSAENARYLKEYEDKKLYIESIISGNFETVSKAIDEWITTSELPVEVAINYNYNQEKNTVFLDVELPNITIIPKTELVRLESGNLRTKNKTQLKIKQEYQKMVLGLAMVIAASVFNISPEIHRIVISSYTVVPKESEATDEEYIYSIKFDRDLFIELQTCTEPVGFCLKFENRMIVTASAIMRRIIPFDSEE